MDTPWLRRLKQVNGELWLLLSLFLIAMLLNYWMSIARVSWFLRSPYVFSAYFYGRRHATLTAVASPLPRVLGDILQSRDVCRPCIGHLGRPASGLTLPSGAEH